MRRMKGFTLIELLVVVAIIAVLISILLPAISKARDTAKRALCSSNQKQLATGCYMYAGDFSENLPMVSAYNVWALFWCKMDTRKGPEYTNGLGFVALYPKYLKVPGAFYCPSSSVQWNTPIGYAENTPWWEDSHGGKDREITYFYLGNRAENSHGPNVVDLQIPKKITDPGDWPLWADITTRYLGAWCRANHPNFGDTPGALGFGGIPDGSNIARLDGGVEWRPVGKLDPNRYGYVAWIPEGWIFVW